MISDTTLNLYKHRYVNRCVRSSCDASGCVVNKPSSLVDSIEMNGDDVDDA